MKSTQKKPVIYRIWSRTISGLHTNNNALYTEEFQVEYYKMNHAVFDQLPHFVIEQLWNFGDFQTKYDQILHIQGKKKTLYDQGNPK